MSIYAFLAAPKIRKSVQLGKPLRWPDGTVFGYGLGEKGARRALLDLGLWKFLGEALGSSLILGYDWWDVYENEIVRYQDINSNDADGVDGNTTLKQYVEPPVRGLLGEPDYVASPFRYYRASRAGTLFGRGESKLLRRRYINGQPESWWHDPEHGWAPRSFDLANYENGQDHEWEYSQVPERPAVSSRKPDPALPSNAEFVDVEALERAADTVANAEEPRAHVHLSCPAVDTTVDLGEPVHRADGMIVNFGAELHGTHRSLLSRAIWKFLAEAATHDILIDLTTPTRADELADHHWITDTGQHGTSYADYTRDVPLRPLPGEPVHYATPYRYYRAVLPDRSPYTSLYRRRNVDGYPDDQRFDPKHGWTPTRDLAAYVHGYDTPDYLPVPEPEATVQQRS